MAVERQHGCARRRRWEDAHGEIEIGSCPSPFLRYGFSCKIALVFGDTNFGAREGWRQAGGHFGGWKIVAR